MTFIWKFSEIGDRCWHKIFWWKIWTFRHPYPLAVSEISRQQHLIDVINIKFCHQKLPQSHQDHCGLNRHRIFVYEKDNFYENGDIEKYSRRESPVIVTNDCYHLKPHLVESSISIRIYFHNFLWPSTLKIEIFCTKSFVEHHMF